MSKFNQSFDFKDLNPGTYCYQPLFSADLMVTTTEYFEDFSSLLFCVLFLRNLEPNYRSKLIQLTMTYENQYFMNYTEL